MPEPHFYKLLRWPGNEYSIEVDNMIPHPCAYVFGNKVRMNSSRFYQLVWLTQGTFDEKIDRCFEQARKNISDAIENRINWYNLQKAVESMAHDRIISINTKL